jgi:hypothetical protein
MTLALRRFVPVLQYLGVLGSALALTTGFLFGERYTIVYGPAGLAALLLDMVAIRARSNATAIVATLMKPVVFVLAASVLIMGGPGIADPILPPSTGPVLLIYSAVPSILGATLRRLTR